MDNRRFDSLTVQLVSGTSRCVRSTTRRLARAALLGSLLLGAALIATPAFAQPMDRGDADGDTMTNYSEYLHGTNPYEPDTDHDGLIDPDEVFVHGTNPNSPDTDGDGMGDWYELNTGSDPLVNGNVPAPAPAPAKHPDRDGDGLYDDDEVNVYGTNPDVWDTDGDGSGDGEEVYYGTNPLG